MRDNPLIDLPEDDSEVMQGRAVGVRGINSVAPHVSPPKPSVGISSPFQGRDSGAGGCRALSPVPSIQSNHSVNFLTTPDRRMESSEKPLRSRASGDGHRSSGGTGEEVEGVSR